MLANELETAWAAGLFEGEGSIVFCRTNELWPFVRISIKMCDKDVLDRFGKIVDIKRLNGPYETKQTKANPHWKPAYEWHTSKKKEVARILSSFLPYLGNRRAYKALNALDLIDNIY